MTIEEFNEITGLNCVSQVPQGNNSSYLLYEQNQTGSGLVSFYEISVKEVGDISAFPDSIVSSIIGCFCRETGYSIRVSDQENHFERDADDSTIWQKTYFELSEV